MTSRGWEKAWVLENQAHRPLEYDRALRDRADLIVRLGALRAGGQPVMYDLGCGGGEVGVAVRDQIGGTIVAVDWNDFALASLRARASTGVQAITADCTSEAFATEHRERADVVLSLGLVEHSPDPGLIVARHARLLRPGGTLALMVPNRRSLVGTSRRIMQFTGRWHTGFQREYAPATARSWCRAADLEVKVAIAVCRPTYAADNGTTKLLAASDRTLASRLADWGWYTWVFARR